MRISSPTIKRIRGKVHTSKSLALFAAQTALEKNALEPVLIDVTDSSDYTDYLLVISGRSLRQVESLGEAIAAALKEQGYNLLGQEGQKGGQWLLLDFGDLIVHVFLHEVRDYYDLEGLWSDAPRVGLKVPPELRVAYPYS